MLNSTSNHAETSVAINYGLSMLLQVAAVCGPLVGAPLGVASGACSLVAAATWKLVQCLHVAYGVLSMWELAPRI